MKYVPNCLERRPSMSDTMILSESKSYSLDCYNTKLNNNVIVVGTSGAGKTTGIVIPNLMQATGSYIVTDPKGNLYKKVGPYLKSKGYKVLSMDLTNPYDNVRYNFMDYIREEHDVIKLANMLMSSEGREAAHGHNAYFYLTAELIFASALAALKGYITDFPEDEEMLTIQTLFNYCQTQLLSSLVEKEGSGENNNSKEEFEDRNNKISNDSSNDWWKFADRLKTCVGGMSNECAMSVLSTIGSIVGRLNTIGVEKMMLSEKESFDFTEIGLKRTALFVRVSDTDRSMDALANTFFSQAMDELCRTADTGCQNEALPVPVRFIMDDFATNCSIEDFPRMISSIRSRNISAMIMLQSESQLQKRYGKDASTIINNCDTYVYMGGNDLETATNIAKRLDLPLKKVLYMPIGTNWIFRRGEEPVNGQIFPGVEKYPELFGVNKGIIKKEAGTTAICNRHL